MRYGSPLTVLALICGAAGCDGGATERNAGIALGGDARRGAQIIRQFNCGSCHTIPGIGTARGVVGPPLYFFSRRTFIAGELPNTPANLVRWVEDPQSVEAGTAMPRLGLNDQQARDVAAYLYTLR